MNQIETETMASADTLIAVVEQWVRDTGHRRAIQVVLGSSLGSELVLDSLARVELVLRVEHGADLRANRPDLRITS